MRHHRPLRYISLFSGIEAASVAAEPLGWEPVCFCEIDPFPSAVLAHHYPNVPNLGDITKVDWREVLRKYGSVDVVVGGSPCESFSIAGKREGLEGASGLMFEYIRAISEIMPKYWVWENVPGALSSSRGADFECFLREMAGIRGAGGERYGIGYRVLDAQFFRVAQRRRRLYAIGVLGDLAGPCEILFESEGLLWDTPSSKQKREALAADARCRTQGAGGGAVGFAQNQHDMLTHDGDEGIHSAVAEPIVMASAHTNAEIGEGGVTPTLIAHIAKDAPVMAMESAQSPATFDDVTVIDRAAFNQGVADDYAPHIEVDTTGPEAVMFKIRGRADTYMKHDGKVGTAGKGALTSNELAFTIAATQDQHVAQPTNTTYIVRRLTPRECERLQGFKDDWTKVPYRGKPAEQCPDGPRYKAIGNSFAVPNVRWIFERIQAYEILSETPVG